MTCTIVEHTEQVVVTPDDCNAAPIVIEQPVSTTVLVESAPDVVEVNAGPRGYPGKDGWAPITAIIADGARRVMQITDWTGGTGTKPATGYVGATGLVATAALAVDLRGATGAAGSITSVNGKTGAAVTLAAADVGAATPLYIQSRGQNLITNGFGLLGDNTNFPSFIYDGVDRYNGTPSFRPRTPHARLGEFIPYVPGATYLVECAAKSKTSGGAPSAWLPILEAYDADGFTISIGMVENGVVAGAANTVLTASLNPGDTTLTVADATGWYSGPDKYSRCLVLYGYTDASGYTYPDYTYSRNLYRYAWNEGGISGNTITLAAPWAGPAFAAGTAISNKCSSDTVYWSLGFAALTNDWVKYSGKVTPTAFIGIAKVRLDFVVYSPEGGNSTRISSVSLREIYPASNISDAGATGISLFQSATPTAALTALGAPVVTQAEAEAGSGTTTRTWTPQRVWQAVAKATALAATKLSTPRTLTIGGTGKNFDGSANVSWTLGEIGAAAASHSHTPAEAGAAPANATLTDAAASSTLPATTSTALGGLLQTVRDCLKWLLANTLQVTGAQTAAGVKTFSDRTVHAGAYTPSLTPAHSATPTFDCAASNSFEPGVMTSSVTSLTMSNPVAGQTVQIRFQQDATGGRTCAVPSGAKVDGAINTGANRVSWLVLTYSGRASRFEGNWLVIPS